MIQLGVGLHAGAALLQMYGDLGIAPLVRTIGRTRSLFLAPQEERPPKAIEDELDHLESKYEIFRIQLFQEYRNYVLVNSFFAVVLAIILAVIAFKAEDPIGDGWEWTIILMVGLSVLPAPITLGVLWYDASQRVKPMTDEADKLEKRALVGR